MMRQIATRHQLTKISFFSNPSWRSTLIIQQVAPSSLAFLDVERGNCRSSASSPWRDSIKNWQTLKRERTKSVYFVQASYIILSVFVCTLYFNACMECMHAKCTLPITEISALLECIPQLYSATNSVCESATNLSQSGRWRACCQKKPHYEK